MYGRVTEFTFILEYLFSGDCSIWIPEEGEASGEGESWFYLQKIGNDWKLYSFNFEIPLPKEPPV